MANRYPPRWLTVHFPHTSTAILKIDVMKRHFEYRPFGDIYTYLINTEGCYTKEKLKAFRSLEAYNYFYNGYVRTVYFYLSGRFGILKAKVNPSQKAAENYHEPWIIICMESGSVMTAHCTCMAG